MPRIKRGVASRARRKKILKAARGYYGARSRHLKLPNRRLLKRGSMPIATVVNASVNLERCGLSALMRQHANMACHIAALSPV